MLKTKRRWRGFPPSPQLPVLAVHQADSQTSLAKASTLPFSHPTPSVLYQRPRLISLSGLLNGATRWRKAEQKNNKLLHSATELLSGRKQVQQKGHRTAFNLLFF